MPLFSIIIPTYNRAHLLPQAIDSVINQTFSDWELVVVDDGSNDHTATVVKDYEKANAKIRYIFQHNQERSQARNQGLAVAKGTYLCFLDDDDYFFDHHLQVLAIAIQSATSPVAIFRTGMYIDYEGRRTQTPLFDSSKHKNPVLFFLENMAGIHTLCFHGNILKHYQFDTRWRHFQDTHLLVRCLLNYPFHQLPAHTCVYQRYPQMGSIQAFAGTDAKARTENNVAAIRDLFQQCQSSIFDYVPLHMEKQLVSEKYLQHAHGALLANKSQLAWEHFTQYFKLKIGWGLWRPTLTFLVKYGANKLGLYPPKKD